MGGAYRAASWHVHRLLIAWAPIVALLSVALAQTSPPVVGGSAAEAGRWPDAAAGASAVEVICTGVLVHPRVVLSAGHCGQQLERFRVDTLDHTTEGETLRVAETFVHPEWWSTYDVAAYLLETPAQTAPRTIARPCVLDQALAPGAPVAIVGWGRTDAQGTQSTTTLQAAFTTVGDPDCADLELGCNAAVSPGGELTAGGAGIDSCVGDSGGPLYLLTDEGDYLLGLTSRGVEGGESTCGHGGIYVRADAIVDWVEAETGVELARPPCAQADTGPDSGEGEGGPSEPGCGCSTSSPGAAAWGLWALLAWARRRSATPAAPGPGTCPRSS